MQFASFDLRDPIVSALGLRLSVQVVTLENLYGLSVDHVETRESEGVFALQAERLAWAGQQERKPGRVELRLDRLATGSLRAVVRAEAPEPIRCVKLLVRDLEAPLGVVHAEGEPRTVGEYGELLAYPRTLPTPVLCIESGGALLGMRAEDEQVREKRFAVSVERVGPLSGRGVVELIHEQPASRFSRELETPPWILTPDASPDELERQHLAFVEGAYGLASWEEREDVPGWARRVRMVATLHGMHFSGRVFLRYDEMLDVLRFLADRIPGEQILAYLPGWEGRYYWQYGDYRPEPRLGGEKGFASLCEGARHLGVHLMPMFGANCANRWLPAMAGLDPSANLKSATGNRFHGNQPDWDLARAHDTGWQAWLNPGHPEWRERLATAIETLAGRHGIDAVFLDTVHAWTNDPDHPVTEGLRALVARLHSNLPGLLLAAEADYDALLPLFPLFQRPWWTKSPGWTTRFVRRFGHLCEGEPRGRTGVHEFGAYASDAWSGEPGYLPTVAFQDGTLEHAREELEQRLTRLASQGGSGP
ncbi:MAG: hypothetical protein QNK05_03870 [Myxococcota bacterium]|nr:hypothetical protein [Myxococcota bacterium]